MTTPDAEPRAERKRSFADTVLSLTEVAPVFPPSLVAHGLELAHQLRRALGDRPVEESLWEDLLAYRRGPGADAFSMSPLVGAPAADLLLDRAVEIRAIVDALRALAGQFPGQPLERHIKKGALRTRRVPLSLDDTPVAVRLGGWFTVLHVGDEHPRRLRDLLETSLAEDARELRLVGSPSVPAPIVVSIDPVQFAEAVHLHRVGMDGPWLGWSEVRTTGRFGVLSGHHLVLEGPAFVHLRAEIRRRSRALRVALGLESGDDDWELLTQAGLFEHVPSADGPRSALHNVGFEFGLPPSGPTLGPIEAAPHGPFVIDNGAGLDLLADAGSLPASPLPIGGLGADDELPESLRDRLRQRPAGFFPPTWLAGAMANPPALRWATLERTQWPFSDLVYAYCRAQHDAMAVHHPRYEGQGFTFVVPWRRTGASRATPVLCSFRTRRGAPEGIATFRRRLSRRLDEAEAGEDLLSQVLDDLLRLPVPEVVRAMAVRLAEHLPGDGGSFLSGRGLISWIEVPDVAVDPITAHSGSSDGLFAGSCQERGGVSLTVVDRGARRDLCAVGSGIFRQEAPMQLFWMRLQYFLSQIGAD